VPSICQEKTEPFVNFNAKLDVSSSRSLFAAIAPAAASVASVVFRLLNSFGSVATEKTVPTLIPNMLISGAVGLVVLLILDSQLCKALLQRTQNCIAVGGTLLGSQNRKAMRNEGFHNHSNL
jgi:hypothetical protein